MLSTPPVLNTDTSTSHTASSSSTCASTDLLLDTHDKKILSIPKEIQCSADQGMVEECTEQCRLTSNFVSDTVFK